MSAWSSVRWAKSSGVEKVKKPRIHHKEARAIDAPPRRQIASSPRVNESTSAHPTMAIPTQITTKPVAPA
jgi:hypothetical protein